MDIVERLNHVSVHGDQADAILVMEEAAKEIKRLRGVLLEAVAAIEAYRNKVEQILAAT